MPTHRHQMPDGTTFRNNSLRRYIVVARGPSGPWQATYRTDKESVALAQWRHEARIAEHAALLDNQTGEVIR